MNQLDAVASESYQLQPVTLEHQETETKESPLIETEKCLSETGTLPENISETESCQVPPTVVAPENSYELHSEEEDKFSDFDPAALQEPDPEISQNSIPVELNANPEDNKDNSSLVKGSDHPPTDDYMSDVSSGEDFLSATHDQSGPEDGEVSEAEETFASKPEFSY